MSFSPPSTYASKANTAYAATFAIGSPPVAVAEIKSFSVDVVSMPEVNKTHLLSPSNTEEFAPGMIHPGKISLSGNWIGDASQLAILTDAQAQTSFNYTILAPAQQGTKTETRTGTGYFSSHKVGPYENNKPIEFSAEIQMTGPTVVTVA